MNTKKKKYSNHTDTLEHTKHTDKAHTNRQDIDTSIQKHSETGEANRLICRRYKSTHTSHITGTSRTQELVRVL